MLYYLLIIWMIQLKICFFKGFSNNEANIHGFATSTQVTHVGEALFFLVSADSENSIVNEKTWNSVDDEYDIVFANCKAQVTLL